MHAHKNDCILYHGAEYKDLEKWPICRLDRFNHIKDNGDDNNCNKRKDRPERCFDTFQSLLI
jgi:hypothetical protein